MAPLWAYFFAAGGRASEAADTSAGDTAWGPAHTAESGLQPRWWFGESLPARDAEQQRSVLAPYTSMR